jgi:hexokinase
MLTIATYVPTFCNIVIGNGDAIPKESQLELGFTFSFPVLQTSINSGTLIDWTKGYNCHGMVGKNPAGYLQQALLSRNLSVNVCTFILRVPIMKVSVLLVYSQINE